VARPRRDSGGSKGRGLRTQKTSLGLIRGTRLENGEWRFEFPGSEPNTPGRVFLESVAAEMRTLLHAKTASAKKHE